MDDVLETQLVRWTRNRCVSFGYASLAWDVKVGRDERVFGHANVKLSAVVGPCIAWIMWAPRLRFGGLAVDACLSSEKAEGGSWLLAQFKPLGLAPSDLELTLVGGSHSSASSDGPLNWAQSWAQGMCLPIHQQDVGGRIIRRVTFNLSDGAITIAHGGWIGFNGETNAS